MLNPNYHKHTVKVETEDGTLIYRNCILAKGKHYDFDENKNIIDADKNIVCNITKIKT